MGDLPPGTVKIEFSFGPCGLNIMKDEVESVISGTQAESKGIKKGWKILMIDGEDMLDESKIRSTLMKKSKAGKKYNIVFSKSADDMKADILAQEAAEAERKRKFQEADAARKKEESEKKMKEEAKAKEIQDRKDTYKAAQTKVAEEKKAQFGKPPQGVELKAPKSVDGTKSSPGNPGVGEVCIKYCQYSECIPLSDGTQVDDKGATHTVKCKLTSKDIDNVYFLTEVMPNCSLHLSTREFKHDESHFYIKEDPQGVWNYLTEKMTYYLYVQQDRKQYEEDMKRMKQVYANAATLGKGGAGGERPEGCSCLYGCPCQDKYTCLDWENRLAVAKAHGMLPLSGSF